MVNTSSVIIKPMTKDACLSAADIHRKVFIRQTLSEEWIEATFNAFPRMLCYVAEEGNTPVGYCIWGQKSGFRPKVILELDQLAVLPEFQGKGIGSQLIKQSLTLVRKQLSVQGLTLQHIMVTTRADNAAQRLYKRVLGAEVEATITNLYSADEVIMIARNVG